MNPTYFPLVKDMLEASEDNTFYFARNTITNSYEYASSPSISDFEKYYHKLPQKNKHFYELIFQYSYIYEYYDLDLKLSTDTPNLNELTNSNLFNWFQTTRNNFIKTLPPNTTAHTKPEWIITTASSPEKLSLHILNKNLIFPNQETTKQFMDLFHNFINNIKDDDNTITSIFKTAIDKSVYSKNRIMRMTNSAKPNSNRYLKPWKEYHSSNLPSFQDTLITSARNDPKLMDKLIYNDQLSILKIDQPNISTYLYTHIINNDNISEEKTYNHIDENFIEQFLNILNPSRSEDYNDWITIGMALKNSGYDFEIWDKWSSNASNYDYNTCLKQWQNFKDEVENGLTIGTIMMFAKQDNPDEYQTLYNTINHKSNISEKLAYPFSQDIEINEKYISDETYKYHFKTHDIIALKSNMNSGKTYSMPSLFDDYKKIIVVYSRISLNLSIYNKWKQHGFQLYSDIKDDYIINTNKYPRIIVQIDSIHRIQGQTDLLILDEIESTHEHLCGSKLMLKTTECYYSLMTYINHTPKVILCDANLKDETINILLAKRDKIIKINNTYKTFSHIHTTLFCNEKVFINHLYNLIEQNKKIVIPTNSKKWAKTIQKMILDKFSNKQLNILRIDMENKFTSTTDWINYDILIYTPTITAGVSFDEVHFDVVCAYFKRKSTSAEQSSQMLFRVRHLKDNKMFICTPPDAEEESRPTDSIKIKDYINDKIKVGNNHLKTEGLKIDKYNEKVKETKYFNLYSAYLRKEFLSFLYLHSYLKQILISHGIKYKYNTSKLDENNTKQIIDEISKKTLEIKIEEAEDIANAIPINDIQYKSLSDKRKELSKDELLSMKRWNVCFSFDKKYDEVLTPLWIKDNIKYIYTIRKYKELKDMKIEECTEYVNNKKEEKYNQMIVQKEYIDTKDDDEILSSDSEYEDDNKSKLITMRLDRNKKKKFLKNIGQTVTDSINYDKTYHKLYHCVNFLKYAGFSKVNDENKIRPDFKSMLEYCRENEKEIRTLFGCKKMEWSEDVNSKGIIQSLTKYINAKLEGCLGVKVESSSKGSLSYAIIPQFNY